MSVTTHSILAKIGALALVAALLAAFTSTSQANRDLPAPVTGWYQALREADAGKFETLLAPEATIELKYLAVTQSREEFISSIEEWMNANKGAEITLRPFTAPSSGPNNVTVDVCYKFTSNEVLNRETFNLSRDMIVSVVQERLAESCS